MHEQMNYLIVVFTQVKLCWFNQNRNLSQIQYMYVICAVKIHICKYRQADIQKKRQIQR